MKLAVIPARGGSKRIPRKNIKAFAGKPMIAWSIEAAQKSACFDQIIVSTDDEEIASIAKSCGARVPFMRPAPLADDHTGTTPVIAHAIEWYRQQDQNPLEVCCIYATAPFIDPEQIQAGLALLQGGHWRYVFSASEFAAPIQRAFQREAGGGLKMFFPDQYQVRSQDLPVALHDAGQFYWGQADAWVENRRIFDHQSTVVLLPAWQVCDIDTPEDWEAAQIMQAANLRGT